MSARFISGKAVPLPASRIGGGHPDTFRENLPPVVAMGKGGSTAVAPSTEMFHVINALVDAGFSIIMPSVPWLLGNATSLDRIDDAIAFARSNLGASDAAPIIVGQSNGGICGLNWARA